MTRLTYRPANVADLPFIVQQIVEDSVMQVSDDPATATAPDYVAALEAITNDPNHEQLIAELDGEPVGSMQLSFVPGLMRRGMWRGIIEGVHIIPEKRNLGLGGEMIRWAVERCRSRGCGVVQLTSNKQRLAAHRFYARLGFEQSHEGFRLML